MSYSHICVETNMSTLSNENDLDLSILDASDYQILRLRIDQQARANASDEFSYRCLINDTNYQRGVTQNYIRAKKSLMANKNNKSNETTVQQAPTAIPKASDSEIEPNKRKRCLESEASAVTLKSSGEAVIRDNIVKSYGVIMSQFETNFRDTTRENLKSDDENVREEIYKTKIGALGMKSFSFENIPLPDLIEAMLLYILDDIEMKERSLKNRGSCNFLRRIGMTSEVSSYYQAHRKNNHGGASCVLQTFNEHETFSFRKRCMKAGLQSDVTVMNEAVSKNSKNHPYLRTFYTHPTNTNFE